MNSNLSEFPKLINVGVQNGVNPTSNYQGTELPGPGREAKNIIAQDAQERIQSARLHGLCALYMYDENRT